MPKTKKNDLTLLGHNQPGLPLAPDRAILETFPNPAKRPYRVRFETTDFTSLCPITGQADFAQLTIEYLPRKHCVETKSLKFYLASFRQERAFNEAVTNRILDDLVAVLQPRELTVTAEFSARGGIALTVIANYPTGR